jgi:hypothetical protein
MVPDSAFRGAARGVVLNAVSGENFYGPVIHFDGKVDDKFPSGAFDFFGNPRIQMEMFYGRLHLSHGDFQGVDLFFLFHHSFPPRFLRS